MNTCSVCRTTNNPGSRSCQLCGTALQPAYAAAVPAQQVYVYAMEPVTHLRYANFFSRLFAAIVDGLIAAVIWTICFGLLYVCGFMVLFGSLRESLLGGVTGAGLMLISAPVGR